MVYNPVFILGFTVEANSRIEHWSIDQLRVDVMEMLKHDLKLVLRNMLFLVLQMMRQLYATFATDCV